MSPPPLAEAHSWKDMMETLIPSWGEFAHAYLVIPSFINYLMEVLIALV